MSGNQIKTLSELDLARTMRLCVMKEKYHANYRARTIEA